MILFRGREGHQRSVVKALTWRVLGSVDTFLLSWLFTSNVKAAGAIASAEVITKMFLYYGHERVWGAIRWGIKDTAADQDPDTSPIPALQNETVR